MVDRQEVPIIFLNHQQSFKLLLRIQPETSGAVQDIWYFENFLGAVIPAGHQAAGFFGSLLDYICSHLIPMFSQDQNISN